MKRLILTLILSCSLTALALGQDNDCFEVKNLEFFVPRDVGHFRWPEKVLSELILSERPPAYFQLPPIVKQLSEYHPACGILHPDNRFELLTKLYSLIRNDEKFVLGNIPVIRKLEMIREDFYGLVNDDKIIPKLIATMDDGPLYGEIPKRTLGKLVSAKGHKTRFGKLTVSNYPTRVVVTAVDNGGNRLWSRVLKGTVPNRYLEAATLEDATLREADAVMSIGFHVDGEMLWIYLRPDGRFLYYTHSW